ncbi:MAG: BamA/TamA family outer membrane protein [Planctomycetes bacterium]|nr:BamA/TamA family outer membrane protein [Planctomycetota bacterium]
MLLLGALFAGGVRAQDAAKPAPQGPPAPPSAQPGDRPIVRAIIVQGARRYTQEQLVRALGQEVGQPFDRERIDRGIDTLLKAFKVRADVEGREVPDGVELRMNVVELPVDLEPRFAGNRDIDVETLRRWAHLDEKSELYLNQAERVRQRLLEGYQQEGYYYAEVDIQKRGEDPASGETPDVIFEIREGPQVRVKEIVITGNHSLPETGSLWWKDGIVHLAKTELDGPWIFNVRGSKYVEETLQADLLAMREVYRDLGWLDAVVEKDFLEFNDDRTGVVIHIKVDEGEPYTVSKLSIRGVKRKAKPNARDVDDAIEEDEPLYFDQEQLLALCKLTAGMRYQRARQRTDAAELRKFYGRRGYLSHYSLDRFDQFSVLEPELVFDRTGHKVEVCYKLQQGRQRYIREVLFSGSEFTRDRVLRREVDVLPGHVADAEEINRSLSRIYGTNYFSDEGHPYDHREPNYRFLPTADPKWLDLMYEVEEGRVVDFNINGGIDSNNGLVGRLSLQMRNFDAQNPPSSFWSTFSEIYDKQAFHGAGQTLQLDLAPGTLYNQARIRFVEPDLFGTQFDRYGLDVSLSTTRRLWRFYTENRAGATVRLSRDFGRNLTLYGGVTTQGLDITGVDLPLGGIHPPDEPALPPALAEEVGQSALNGLTFDLRYLDLDNRINPYEGLSVNWRNAWFGGPLGGNWDFLRSQLDLDAFFVLGHREEEQAQPHWHASVGLGIADPLGSTSAVPYTERFYLGGLTTLRGFANRGVGPNTRGEPDGGETMLDATLEYQIPISTQTEPGSYRERETFRFLLFADAGVLDPDAYHLDFSELRSSVGFGLGMAYPLPINLYFGFPTRRGDGDRRQTFGFNISAFGF